MTKSLPGFLFFDTLLSIILNFLLSVQQPQRLVLLLSIQLGQWQQTTHWFLCPQDQAAVLISVCILARKCLSRDPWSKQTKQPGVFSQRRREAAGKGQGRSPGAVWALMVMQNPPEYCVVLLCHLPLSADKFSTQKTLFLLSTHPLFFPLPFRLASFCERWKVICDREMTQS